ncbi:hypothetical protein DY000_02053507 [Brassica cretica]|uniref:Uncharacterized protein n=1 Tax=Brassica cretica TaxID=69181 RepID=A0ABQ7ALZ4_BRACR|nr:hypothetical protein DY000_02053507 [Brassica cretica]
MARITHLPHRHAATRSRVASPITCDFTSCPGLILEVSLPPKPTNRRQLGVLATILDNKTKLCGQPPKHPIEMPQELLGGVPVKEKHMSSCLKEVSKQLHLPEASGYA